MKITGARASVHEQKNFSLREFLTKDAIQAPNLFFKEKIKMNKSEFLKELEDVLQKEDPINAGDVLNDYDEWDSLSKMAVMAFYGKEFNIKLTLNDIKNLETVEDLIKLAGNNIND